MLFEVILEGRKPRLIAGKIRYLVPKKYWASNKPLLPLLSLGCDFNLTALRKAKTVCNFCLSECNRVKLSRILFMAKPVSKGHSYFFFCHKICLVHVYMMTL